MALFRWVRVPRKRAKVGDKRVVSRVLLLPTEIGGEVRWLGIERIKQEAYIGWICAPEMRPYKGLKWRDLAWVDA